MITIGLLFSNGAHEGGADSLPDTWLDDAFDLGLRLVSLAVVELHKIGVYKILQK